MRNRWHFYFLCVIGTIVLVACGGPNAPQNTAALLNDADLDSAAALPASQGGLPTIDAQSVELADLITRDGSSAGATFSSAAVESASRGRDHNRGDDDLGGYVAYVEQKGKTYSIRLVDLSDKNSPERRGDRIVYRGRRAIQSVAVSSDGQSVAFIAATKSGDNDVFLLDPKRHRVVSSSTPDTDERDVSMSLDGRGLAWQGGTAEEPSFVWFHEEIGGYVEFDAAQWAEFNLPALTTVQPSLSGDGFRVVFVETSGVLATLVGIEDPTPSVATMEFVVLDGSWVNFGITVQYLGSDIRSPSISYSADALLVLEIFDGTPYLSLLDFNAGTLTDLLVGFVVDHPYLTADGDYATFANGGEVFLVDFQEGTLAVLSPSDRTEDSATYWARGNFESYTGVNDEGTFVRPGDGLDEAGRTVGYHAHVFRPATDDVYEILSSQFYDGYLNLYAGSFNPKKPERNLMAGNDDFGGGWDPEIGVVQSRIVAELQRNQKYTVVTSACGAPGTPCGPSEGFFRNSISGGATLPPPPPPPTELPEPDNSRFNITLRFWNDSFTEAEKVFFEVAADRWAEVITGDITNIPGLVLTEAQTTDGAPGIFGELDDVIIDAAKVPIDAAGGVLARAGAFYVRNPGTEDQYLPVYGIMEFDEFDFGPGGFFENLDGFSETILHEMAHVLGISRSTWIPLELIAGNPTDGSCSDVADPVYNDPRYLGAAGNDAWVNTYGADTSTVPVANTNGCGTADSHWREIYLQDEIMTGFAQGGGEPISEVTIGAFQDLGYEVDMSQAELWSIPALPSLSQVSPNPTSYDVETDFTSAFTNSLLGEVEDSVTAVGLELGLGNMSTSGCEVEDFIGFPAGDIALLQRGVCAFGLKAQNALDAGASGVLIGNQGDTEDRMLPPSGTFGDTPIGIIGMPISYDLMVELSETPGVVVRIDTDTTDSSVVLGPQALPTISWHIAEELVEIRGAFDEDGNFIGLGD